MRIKSKNFTELKNETEKFPHILVIIILSILSIDLGLTPQDWEP